MIGTMAIMRWIVRTCGVLVVAGVAVPARAGGGPANVLVVYNADEPAAVEVAEHYATARSLPPGHTCPIHGIVAAPKTYAGDGLSWTDYTTLVRDPFRGCLAALPQPDDIDYVVVVKGLIDKVLMDGEVNPYTTSLEAMIAIDGAYSLDDDTELAGRPQFYYPPVEFWVPTYANPAFIAGLPERGDYPPDANPAASNYASATRIVRATELPASFRRMDAGDGGRIPLRGVPEETIRYAGHLFVVTRLDAFTYEEVHDVIDRGVASDGTFPTAEILCMAAEDEARGPRDAECEFAVDHLVAAGFDAVYLPEFDGALAGHDVVAYFTGAAELHQGIDGNTYVPGAIVSNITSAGSIPANFDCTPDGRLCPYDEDQTSNAFFLRAGATGVEGAVTEPTSLGFPRAGTLLLYTFGYNLAESYFFNTPVLYWQNSIVGDPLASPFAERPEVVVYHDADADGDPPALAVRAEHPDGVRRVELYLDGVRVGAQDGDAIDHPLDAPLGDAHVLAVAFADDVAVERTGWPEPEQHPRPDVQGWSTALVDGPPPDGAVDSSSGGGATAEETTDATASTSSGSSADDPSTSTGAGAADGEGAGDGCACHMRSPSSARFFAALVLVVAARRRRTFLHMA
jgi:MYXO-CTERM domain-containing protein